MNATAPAQPELVGDLWAIAQTTAGGRGFQFSPECAGEVKRLIETGVAKLIEDGALNDATRIRGAKDAVVQLVGQMIEAAIEAQRGQVIKAKEATSPTILHEYSVFSARKRFCPCYPFC